MALSEFSLIESFFERRRRGRDDVALGIGDDAALLRPPIGMLLATAVDTLIEGVHFPVNTPPEAIGHKALAVNLSDLAAMGAEPAWATLSLSMPEPNEAFLKAFADGLFALAEQFDVELVGGDTVRGPLVLTVQVTGFVPEGDELTRAGARPGDLLYVSGTLGDAAAGLEQVQSGTLDSEDARWLRERLDRPTPRVALGQALRGVATSCIDISDGLCADLGHIMERSILGAEIDSSLLPLSSQLLSVKDEEAARQLALYGGDDYELCFTVPETKEAELMRFAATFDVPITKIGEVNNEVSVMRIDGEPVTTSGYDHFRGAE
ncbi:MAG: thiamine-phosphate kinase [Chromatiales bacterium]|nr:thiamine-phosphate kinase [Chromatiales bacterium]